MDDSVESEGVVDIFAAARNQKAGVSTIDNRFLMTFKDEKIPKDLRLKLLNKLLDDAIRQHQRRNLAKAKSFRQILEETLRKSTTTA